MNKSDIARLVKIEDMTKQFLSEDLGLELADVEFDIIPPQKMMEIMSYNHPTNISNWKFGRNYEKQRTIYDHYGDGMPYEVVIYSNPSRAYLMKTNTFAVQCLVLTHVYGHVIFSHMNKWFAHANSNMVEFMGEAAHRVDKYIEKYGIDAVETIVDAGHALQFHSNPFEIETEDQRKLRVFEQMKLMRRPPLKDEWADFFETKEESEETLFMKNEKLWREIKKRTPIEPLEDILGFIIDNSNYLEDWEKDILSITRVEGQYFWPLIRTKYMNEGFATMIHEKTMDMLFKKGILSTSEHAEFNYANSLVKAPNKYGLNPYLLGSEMWKDIEKRWNRGMHGIEWEECDDMNKKENWDTKENAGWEKCKDVLRTHNDWFFMQSFLTNDFIREQKVYLYVQQNNITKDMGLVTDYVITDHEIDEIRKIIINSFTHSGVPQIFVISVFEPGDDSLDLRNLDDNKQLYYRGDTLLLKHNFVGATLDKQYTEKTLHHIMRIWGTEIILITKNAKGENRYFKYNDNKKIEVIDVKQDSEM